MAQGERDTALDEHRLVHRQRLRVRTVAVSFAAAVSSATEEFAGSAGERDALVEVWRAWSIEQLERYRLDIDELARQRPELATEIAELLRSLDDAVAAVRAT